MKQFISSCALMMALTPALAHANDVVGTEPTEVKTTEATATQQAESPSTMEQILARLPKISGYLQTGWNYNRPGKRLFFVSSQAFTFVDGWKSH